MIRGGTLRFYEPYRAPTTASGRVAGQVSPARLRDGNALTSPENPGAWAGTRRRGPRSGEPTSPAQPRGVGRLEVGAKPRRGPGGRKSPLDSEDLAGAIAPPSAEAGRTRWPSFPGALRRGGPRRTWGWGSGRAAPPRSPTKFGTRAGPRALARGRPPSAAPCDPPVAPEEPLGRQPELRTAWARGAEEGPLGCGRDPPGAWRGSPSPTSVCVALLVVFSPMCGFFLGAVS